MSIPRFADIGIIHLFFHLLLLLKTYHLHFVGDFNMLEGVQTTPPCMVLLVPIRAIVKVRSIHPVLL